MLPIFDAQESPLQDWPDLRSHVVICIESLELAQSVQQDPAIQSIFVMYNFLPHFCQSAQEQCTEPNAKGHGALHYSHAVVRLVHSLTHQCGSLHILLLALQHTWAPFSPSRASH